MSPALIPLIANLAPIAVKWGTDIVESMISAIHNAAAKQYPAVTVEEIRAVFIAFHKFETLAAYEDAGGVKPEPDGSVKPS
jgi:hypothetical protein